MAANTITRTIATANAWAWLIDGVNVDGTPNVVKSQEVTFTSTAPNQAQAFKALKNAGIKCRKDMAMFDIVGETTYAMSLDEFLESAIKVERKANGTLVPIED